MLPRFGLFEHSDSPPAPSEGAADAGPQGVRRKWRDPSERAFSSRYTGVVDGARAGGGDANGGRDSRGGTAGAGAVAGSVEDLLNEYRAGGEAGTGVGGGGDGEPSEEEEEDSADDFEAHQEDQRIIMGKAAGSEGDGVAGGGGGGKAGAKFLPTARPSGYSEGQLRR